MLSPSTGNAWSAPTPRSPSTAEGGRSNTGPDRVAASSCSARAVTPASSPRRSSSVKSSELSRRSGSAIDGDPATRGRRENGPMRKIDAFSHVLPAGYLQHLERHLASTMRPAQLRYYQEGVFRFDPVISDLDARFRLMDRHGDYAQVLVLGVPPLEEVDPPQAAAELARRANEEMADLVRRFPDRFAGFAAALPLGDVEASLTEIDHAVEELGALGVQVFTNVRGTPLDHPRFDPVLARMEALERMIWLHPTRDAAWPDYPTESESDFGIWWSLGWPYETA